MDGQSKAILLQGINHNETKIGVKDGMCEDLVNLRFKDGSWRPSGDGKKVFSLTDSYGHTYSQLYVHTNVYRHLLGVYDGKLWWIANISADGVFTPITPAELTSVYGNVSVSQTGHLITIIDENDDFEFFVFKKDSDKYIFVNAMKEDNKNCDNELTPAKYVNFSLESNSTEYTKSIELEPSRTQWSGVWGGKKQLDKDKFDAIFTCDDAKNLMKSVRGEAAENNLFCSPFLICSAIELYDGTYILASNPILINPNEDNRDGAIKEKSGFFFKASNAYKAAKSTTGSTVLYCLLEDKEIQYKAVDFGNEQSSTSLANTALIGAAESVWSNVSTYHYSFDGIVTSGGRTLTAGIKGRKLKINVGCNRLLIDNSDIFNAFCIFVTPEVDIERLDKDGKFVVNMNHIDENDMPTFSSSDYLSVANISYSPTMYDKSKVIEILSSSTFHLLKRYTNSEIIKSGIVDIYSSVSDEGLLKNISSKDVLKSDSVSRSVYIPMCSYSYNGRLHIANYKKTAFNGYPLCQFVNNNLVGYNSSDYTSYLNGGEFYGANKSLYDILESLGNRVFGYIKTTIDTDDGQKEVTKYIPVKSYREGGRDEIGLLNPVLSYPDARAKKIKVHIAKLEVNRSSITSSVVKHYEKEFELTPLLYYDMAVYIEPNLKPIGFQGETYDYTLNTLLTKVSEKQITDSDCYGLIPEYSLMTESYPNGLKVSSVDNPMYFPAKNTYQVGSAEIVAMCSNAIAVGTGQTGQAPLYVFCKDGVYALMVDASGEMTYTNARVIARDVCNNGKSVTPIDAGVVFTTDRGLMCIAGEQVDEIGMPLEGDYEDFSDGETNKKNKIVFNAYTMGKLASLLKTTITDKLFLDFLKGSIVNYNHNERELMVSNPSSKYTYVLDREGNWSRRDYTADEYVNNYPTSYRVEDGEFYQVDKESDSDNGIFAMSNVIKLESIGFKEINRLVARGNFKSIEIGGQSSTQTSISMTSATTGSISSTSGIIDESSRQIYNGTFVVNKDSIVSIPHFEILTMSIDVDPTEYLVDGSLIISGNGVNKRFDMIGGYTNGAIRLHTNASSFRLNQGTYTIKLTVNSFIKGLEEYTSRGFIQLATMISEEDEVTSSIIGSTSSQITFPSSDKLCFRNKKIYYHPSYGVDNKHYLSVVVGENTYRIDGSVSGSLIVFNLGGIRVDDQGEPVDVSITLCSGSQQYLDGSIVIEGDEEETSVLTVYSVASTSASYTVNSLVSPSYNVEKSYLGLYVYGSYDGRTWALLGHKEKSGDFRDIGTLVERTDCRFFRFVLAGQLTDDSRLDYFEVSAKDSKLSKKIR